jgi:hypothetical protein
MFCPPFNSRFVPIASLRIAVTVSEHLSRQGAPKMCRGFGAFQLD